MRAADSDGASVIPAEGRPVSVPVPPASDGLREHLLLPMSTPAVASHTHVTVSDHTACAARLPLLRCVLRRVPPTFSCNHRGCIWARCRCPAAPASATSCCAAARLHRAPVLRQICSRWQRSLFALVRIEQVYSCQLPTSFCAASCPSPATVVRHLACAWDLLCGCPQASVQLRALASPATVHLVRTCAAARMLLCSNGLSSHSTSLQRSMRAIQRLTILWHAAQLRTQLYSASSQLPPSQCMLTSLPKATRCCMLIRYCLNLLNTSIWA
jgi:hypothetical protein